MNNDLPVKPLNSRFTDGQWQAVYEEGHNILVSASAGSGKTTVLVQRVIEKIKSGVNVDELLIVTYTESAAREMKERIQIAIQKAITQEGEAELKRHLVKQVSLLSQASISTLHAFCLQVIRRYYYLIDLDPVFRLLTDETEMLLLKEDVWEELREELYGEEKNAFYELTANYSGDRNDDGLTKLIFSLYEFSRANPNPALWLTQLSDLYRITSTDIGESKLFLELLKPQILEILKSLIQVSRSAVVLADGTEELKKHYDLVASEAVFFEELVELVDTNNYNAAFQFISDFSFGRIPTVKKSADEAIKEVGKEIKILRDQYKKRFGELKESYFYTKPINMLEIMASAAPLVDEMARVTQLFTDAYRKEKAKRNVLDFNDLEHLTHQILATFTDEQWTGTTASDYYREKFQEVLVDEYQDVNKLQESIVYWLTKHGEEEAGNLFMVGDVKQSIYSFRLADPSLFLTKYEQFGQHQNGERIILAENFRSRGEVLHFTNLIFQQLMDKNVGQMVYDEAATLIHGFPNFPESTIHQPEVLIFEKGASTSEEEETEVESLEWNMRIDDKTEGELLMVGQKIQQLIASEFPIYDKELKQNRPIHYQDIVLLTPTKKNNLVLLDIFKRLAIPIHVNDTQNYFQTTEIKIMMSLLKVIDNPYQDIPLAAVLRSPIVGLDENELASIRITKKTGEYYEALESFYHQYEGRDKASHFTTELYEKIAKFRSQLLSWREMARREELVRLIWRIYEETGFLDYVGGMSAGKQRQANLHALYERASRYEASSFKGLFQFVRFIEKMQEKDKDLAEPTAVAPDEKAVRVMTIHASKGLEFPVVFVLDLTKRFNLQDTRSAYVFNEEYGVGTNYKDLEKRITYRTLPEVALKIEKKKKLLAEEMRKLYVALTRAEEKLFLVGSYASQEVAWKEWGAVSNHKETVLPGDMRLTASHMMKWIGSALVRHPNSQNDYVTEIAPIGDISQHPASFSIEFKNEEQIQASMNQKENESEGNILIELANQTYKSQEGDEDQKLQTAIQLMAFNYPYESATRTTSYQSVSEIKRLFEEPEDTRMVKIDINQPRNRFVEQKLARPKFMQELTEPTAAEIGTATHLVMQSIDLTEKPTIQSLELLIKKLVMEELLTPQLEQKLSLNHLVQFFETDLGQQLITHHDLVRREQPFSLLMKAEDIFHDMEEQGEDNILIHGIVDGFIEFPDYIVLYDFKTDSVPKNGTEKIIQKYRGQLNLYQEALASILGKPVKESYICLLSIGEVFQIKKSV
ncbi:MULTISPECIES: helicase-exonuclease AddAB subunit AddA [Carnobacterium]|uniref:helicase-exonuclease AddAB subunit AddA n=1 Tax=Carnobacterium TaxID=2747 RepID=UPI002890D2AA|nr:MULTISPECIES: helicase-exonuclease AddAB subunit AddA [Carnobacterium]MDT1938806.1 helicase-exonuclease AddAB subunit AddA [Carnobacterium divergens]MDT1941244.1 helicase-exonuclease AddAB subunit AddA [Carnobacterium divergens]MDT1947042.1 helicase-exonuclease AddAB subunit AddA [Carnobacterium divergens]MDV8933439.1 helicase-exonuclease AddAB subunit AddA [Carnobacterium sp.]